MSEPHKTLGTPGGVGQPGGGAHGAPTNEVANPSPASNGAHTTMPANGATNTSPASGGANGASVPAAKAEGVAATSTGVTNNNVSSAPTGAHSGTNSSASATQNNSANPAEQRIQFHSAQTSQAVKPKDYFAEQNAKQAEKNQASAKTRKRLLIILGAVIGVVVIALIAWLVVWLNSEPEVVYTGETVYFNDETIAENMTNLQNLAQSALNQTNGSNDDNSGDGADSELGNDLAAAEVVFAHALSVPENKNYASQINLSKEIFYQNNGYYELLLENMNKVNPNDLTAEQRAAYYSAVSMAYYYTGDKDKSNEYIRLAQDAQRELGEFGG